jgi:hypothetical protein
MQEQFFCFSNYSCSNHAKIKYFWGHAIHAESKKNNTGQEGSSHPEIEKIEKVS